MSTAKSMAAQYLSNKRQQQQQQLNGKANTLAHSRFKSSTSNLAPMRASESNNPRSKSTSMTNLVSADQATSGSRIQRPASRNALDSIHNGMNAKYAQIQSKVLLQNIRPQQSSSSINNNNNNISKIPKENNTIRKQQVKGGLTSVKTSITNERATLLSKVKSLQDDLDKSEMEKEELRKELEREKSEKGDQMKQVKMELQEKLQEHERQNEEYHQKLLEAYELADQNRRAADSLLRESRQRDEESRKKVEELESQLNELREFVAIKEEMNGKMFELREQLREERERYEEQLKTLHQVFENEKISLQNKSNQLDQNSNYFKRIKPILQSSESINKRSNCRKCQSGSSQLHCSEHDIYGSKLSTRMQDTAKSAWKRSKQIASSVITGGARISNCRKRGASVDSIPPATFVRSGVETSCEMNGRQNGSSSLDELEQHTSVVEVGGCLREQETSSEQQPKPPVRQQQQQAQQQQSGEDTTTSVIHVDANNKLTIVTKFSEAELSPASSSGSPEFATGSSSSNGSERSRCESSSSGRGTVSDAGSAASQDGETEPNEAKKVETEEKRHRRRASGALSRASKVLSGSQASINKLKSFFMGANKVKLRQQPVEVSASLAQNDMSHLESSRLRCMELNQAIRMASSGNNASNEEQEEQQVVAVADGSKSASEVGQGGSVGAKETLSQPVSAVQ